MFDLFGKIEEFFKDIMIDVIKDNLSAMLVDINDKVSTVATEVGKTPSSWNSEVFTFIKSINENVVLPIAAIILTAILCIELIQVVMNKNSMHERVFSVIQKSLEPLSKKDIVILCPDISQRTIERALKELQDNEKIKQVGSGRSTKYVRI